MLRGSILNFSANMDTVLQQQRLHHTLLKGLYREKVLTVMAKYSARFLKPPNDGSEKKQGVTNLFRSDPQKAVAAEAAFVAVGSALSCSDFAAELDNMYYDRGSEWPPCTGPCSYFHMLYLHCLRRDPAHQHGRAAGDGDEATLQGWLH